MTSWGRSGGLQPPQHRVHTSLITLLWPQIQSLKPCMARPTAKVKGRATARHWAKSRADAGDVGTPSWDRDGAVGRGPPVLQHQGQPRGVGIHCHVPTLSYNCPKFSSGTR